MVIKMVGSSFVLFLLVSVSGQRWNATPRCPLRDTWPSWKGWYPMRSLGREQYPAYHSDQ